MLVRINLGRFKMYLVAGKEYDAAWDKFLEPAFRVAWLGKKFWVYDWHRGLRDAKLDKA